MNGKCELKEGCKVVAIMDGAKYDADLSEVKCGATFTYRGESPQGVHQFGPDYDRYGRVNGLIGFQIPESDMHDFYTAFRVLAPDAQPK